MSGVRLAWFHPRYAISAVHQPDYPQSFVAKVYGVIQFTLASVFCFQLRIPTSLLLAHENLMKISRRSCVHGNLCASQQTNWHINHMALINTKSVLNKTFSQQLFYDPLSGLFSCWKGNAVTTWQQQCSSPWAVLSWTPRELQGAAAGWRFSSRMSTDAD